MPTTRETLDVRREAQTIAAALCTCSQSHGRHALGCVVVLLRGGTRLTDALTTHDRRLLAASEEFCSSCGEAVDSDNLCRVNGVTYHLGNCPRPHAEPPLPETYDADAARPGWEMLSSDGTPHPAPPIRGDPVTELADFDPETGHLHECSRTFDGYNCVGNGARLGTDHRDCAALLYTIAQDTETRSIAWSRRPPSPS